MLNLEAIKNTYDNLKEDKDKFNEFSLEIVPLLIKEVKKTREEVTKVVELISR